jgi:hypothetical protein
MDDDAVAVRITTLAQCTKSTSRLHAQLSEESAVLDRLMYKSANQHRTMVWLRKARGSRRVVRRVLGEVEGYLGCGVW